MRAVVQRIRDGSVVIDGRVAGEMPRGLLVYLGIGREDGERDLDYLVDKIRNLRVFPDETGRMNRSLLEAGEASSSSPSSPSTATPAAPGGLPTPTPRRASSPGRSTSAASSSSGRTASKSPRESSGR